MDYIVLFEGVAYGPFTTNNGTVANTDATHWRNNNIPGAPIMEMLPVTSWQLPIPEADTTG